MLERDIARASLVIGEFQVALSEGPARNILAGQANGCSFQNEAAKS
jgi:hypothetical protein